jgi:hypothetical protein
MAVEVKGNSYDRKIKYFGSLDKIIFESYTKVIEGRIKAGRDTASLIARLELLLTRNNK